MLLPARTAEAAGAALRLIQNVHFIPDAPRHRRKHHLSNAVSRLDGKGLLSQVYQDNANLSPVV